MLAFMTCVRAYQEIGKNPRKSAPRSIRVIRVPLKS